VLTFATLVIGDLGLILANRAVAGTVVTALRARKPALWLVMGGAVLLLAAVVVVPGPRDLFRFGALHADDLATIAAASLLALLWLDAVRLVRRWLGPRVPAASPAHG
jgi:Ca2+-transporting ATPase